MKSFLYKVIWFLIPVFLLSVAMEYSVRQLDNTYKLKKQYLDQHADEIEVLVLGSSHAFYNVNPEYISRKSFNAGAVSQSFDLDLAILEKYENELTNLKTIVLPVSYFTFYGTLKDSPEKWRLKDYVLYYDLDVSTGLKDHFEVISIKPKNNLRKLYKAFKNGQQPLNCSELGWGTNYTTRGSINLETSGKEAALRHSESSIFSEESKLKFNTAYNDLKSIVEWSERKGVRILLFIPPGYSTYTSNLNADQLNQIETSINALAKTYSNCKALDFLKDSSFIENDFYDADHLNHQGAHKLTLKLNSYL